MSEEKIQNTKEALLELSNINFRFEPDRTFIRNGANAINQLQQENKQLKEKLKQSEKVIEECKQSIDNFMTHIDDSFCADMMTFIDILDKYKKEESE